MTSSEERIKVGDVQGKGIAIGHGAVSIVVDVHGVERRLPLQRAARPVNFTGREKELAELVAWLRPGNVVTLWGSGGIGKSSIAAEAVWQLAPEDKPPDSFPGGIVWHSFYTEPRADQALSHIAHSFGEEPGGGPASEARRALAGRDALLVLDGAEVADDLQAVLDVRGSSGVLVTSRRRKDALDKRVDVTALPKAEALLLLQKWAGKWAADPSVASEIIKLVGRLPLAVRLVGRYLQQQEEPAADYLEWLREQRLEALNLGLKQKESVPLLLQRSVAQVSESASQILSVTGLLALAPFDRSLPATALETREIALGRPFTELVDFGLLLRAGNGYEVSHALIYRYAQKRMAAPVGAAERLGAMYRKLVPDEVESGIEGFARLNQERPHILMILDRLLESQEWQAVNDLGLPLQAFLELRGYWTDRIIVCEAGLVAARMLEDRISEAKWLGYLGSTNRNLGRSEQAIEYHEMALALCRQAGDQQNEGLQLGFLAMCCSNLGRLEEAVSYSKQALSVSRKISDRRGTGNYLNTLGAAYRYQGELEKAIDCFELALAISRETADRQGEGIRLGNLGNMYKDLGQVERAIEFHEQALTISREIGDRRNEGLQLNGLGVAFLELEQLDPAIEFFQQALAIRREIGSRRLEGNSLGNLGAAHSYAGRPEQALGYFEQALAFSQEVGDQHYETFWLGWLAETYSDLGQPKRAVEFAQQSLAIAREIGSRQNEAYTLQSLGDIYRAQGLVKQAAEYYLLALPIFDELKLRNADEVRQSLEQLDLQ